MASIWRRVSVGVIRPFQYQYGIREDSRGGRWNCRYRPAVESGRCWPDRDPASSSNSRNLEIEAKRKLNTAGIAGASDLTVSAASQVCIDVAPIGVIEGIKELSAKRELGTIGDWKLLR